MAVITYDNKFEVQPGEYLAVFRELADKDPFENSAYGNGGRRYGWRFEVVGPPGTPEMGKFIEQNTGQNPSRKSGLIRLLNMMMARQGGIQPKQSIDPAVFVGRLYRIQWLPNPDSDKGNCHIASLAELGADAATTPPPRTITPPVAVPPPTPWPGGPGHRSAEPFGGPATPTPAGPSLVPPGMLPVPPAPPPRNKQQAPRPAAPAPVAQRYFVVHETLEGGQKPALLTGQELQSFIDQYHVAPDALEVCAEGAQEWKTAKDFGFKDSIPY